MGAPTGDTKRPLVRLAVVALTIPLMCSLVSAVLLFAWRDDLPDKVATHWGAGGEPDGFTSVTGVLGVLVVGGIVLGVVALIIAAVCADRRLCAQLISGVAGMAAFVCGLTLAVTGTQLGSTDASAAELPWWVLAVGFAAGGSAAALVYRMVPPWSTPAVPAGSESGPQMPIGSAEVVVWTRSVLSAGVALVLMVVGVVTCLVLAVATGLWVLFGVAAALAAVAVVMYGIRVTVDPRGLSITSIVGWPRVVIPASEIATVHAVQVSAIKDFGGYGYRLGFRGELKGAKGFVLRSGEGILVVRTDGARQIVVVDDATTGVRLLEAYRLRAQDAA
ncbi:DUF1648 domain-containing protein [Williamsia sp.]|uniref:DUF1648 domain-containing protein n=1 Tax=Williamsia sp. TaxID=1872085 RepID=UPI002F94B900